MKKGLILILALVFVFNVAALAFAAQTDPSYGPIIEITAPTGPIYVGDSFTVKATTSAFATGNAIVTDYWTDWNDDQHDGVRVFVVDLISYPNPEYDQYDPDSEEFLYWDCWVNTLTLTAPSEAGSYNLKYYIRMAYTTGPSDKLHERFGEDEETIVVLNISIVVDYPAAPAVANEILKGHNISNTYLAGTETITRGKKTADVEVYNNYISQVAKEMTNGAAFPAYEAGGAWDRVTYIEKIDKVAYAVAVENYLRELMRLAGITCPF